ncbi:MAG: TetR family transcriptional regulator [Acidobacteriota bacterium]
MNEALLARTDTKSKILDAAEKLFSIKGFQETSLRDITAEADVNLAAVNYHFQSKDSLIDAVIARLVEPKNRARIQLLDAAGPDATVEQILAAFLNPLCDAPIEALGPLFGRVLSHPDMFVDRVFMKHFAPLSQRFGEALSRAMPEMDRTELVWRMQFCVGVMTHLLTWGKIVPRVTGGVCDMTDRQDLLNRTVEFLAAGFHAPAHKGLGHITTGNVNEL